MEFEHLEGEQEGWGRTSATGLHILCLSVGLAMVSVLAIVALAASENLMIDRQLAEDLPLAQASVEDLG